MKPMGIKKLMINERRKWKPHERKLKSRRSYLKNDAEADTGGGKICGGEKKQLTNSMQLTNSQRSSLIVEVNKGLKKVI